MVDINAKPSSSMLREIKIFKSFSDAELNQIISLGTSASYEAHGNIVIEGELSWGLYVIVSGIVGIFKTNKLTGTSFDVGQLRGGSVFGEMSLVDDDPRSATVKALTDSAVFYISKDSFTTFLNGSADLKSRFYQNCITVMVRRLRELNDDFVISQYQLWQVALKKEDSR